MCIRHSTPSAREDCTQVQPKAATLAVATMSADALASKRTELQQLQQLRASSSALVGHLASAAEQFQRMAARSQGEQAFPLALR